MKERADGDGRRPLAALLVLASVSLGACGGGGGDGGGGDGAAGGSTVSSQPLAGMIGGQPWTFVAGQTDAFLSSMGDTFFANLYDMPFDTPCAELQPAGATRNLILNIPKTVGQNTITLAFNQTFSYKDPSLPNGDYQNDIATTGELDVTELTATTIKGGVKMSFGTEDAVDGQFEITICAQ